MADSKPVHFHQVLRAELAAVRKSRARRLEPAAAGGEPGGDVIAAAHGAGLVGLAFSGGGIRSATFNLGVLQALAELRLLRWVDYLSTVSGGGYIGSWLTAWISRCDGVAAVETALVPQPGAAFEPRSVSFLRQYSNYLTPRLGLFGADTWTALSIYLRNLTLNFAILVSALFALLLVPRLAMWVFRQCGTHAWSGREAAVLFLLIGIGGIGVNLVALSGDERRRAAPPAGYTGQPAIQLLVVLPALLAGWFGVCWLWTADENWTTGDWALITSAVYTILWAIGWGVGTLVRAVHLRRTGRAADSLPAGGMPASEAPRRRAGVSLATIAVSGAVAGAFGGILLSALEAILMSWTASSGHAWHALVWGVPLALTVFTLTVVLHIGLMGRHHSEEAREWWSRLGAWLLIYGCAWVVLFGIAIYGPLVLGLAEAFPKLSGFAGSAWVLLTGSGILAGKSAATGPRRGRGPLELLAKTAPYLFIVGLVLALALTVQLVLTSWAGWPLDLEKLYLGHWTAMWSTYESGLHLRGFVLFVAVALVLSWRIDVNEFSLHHLYRNRLVRCYLGASNTGRQPHPFTGFARDDDVDLADLKDLAGPYPIVNTALNLVRGRQLAWQQRKAASFVFTPEYCGYQPVGDDLVVEGDTGGFRPTRDYGGGGLTLGTAFAISGAAASPNMGYHSSPPLAFLMTVFNVRLGWWLGNPRRETWRLAGPRLGLWYLLAELFGATDENSRCVYLSDGGHFENLALYELIRRRCRFVIACDAGQDGDLGFGDLGNAIRKCRTDLGVELEIDVEAIRSLQEGRSRRHFAVGVIHYERVDPNAQPGVLLYLKPSLTAGEPAEPTDLLNYRVTDPAFPHQSTGDQWFDEAQFESYRVLGHHVGITTLGYAVRAAAAAGPATPETVFAALQEQLSRPPAAAAQVSSAA